MRTSPKPKSSSTGTANADADAYDKEYFEAQYTEVSAQHPIYDLLLETVAITPSAKVLDLGCGQGHLLARLTQEAGLAIGVDVSRYSIAKTSEHAQVLMSDLEQRLPFKDATFDVVFAKDVIEHVNDFGFVMAEIGRVTRPGGKVLIVTPNFLAIKNLLFLVFGHKDRHYFDPTHRWFFSYVNTSGLTQGYQVITKTTNWIFTPKTRKWFRRVRILTPLGDSILLVLRKPNEAGEH